MRRLPALPLLACLLLAACDRAPAPAGTEAAVPAADPAQAVLAASQRFATLRSFHAELEVLGAPEPVRSAMDFVAPDRFRLQTAAGPQTIIGDTMFLQADGGVRQVPTPPGLLEQWRNPLPADALPADLRAEDLGSQSLDGVETRHYRLRGAQPGERMESGWTRRACLGRSYAVAAATAAASSCACAIRASTTRHCASIYPEWAGGRNVS
nr:hypothetical protein [uncultured Stenotrophomonas sp.]